MSPTLYFLRSSEQKIASDMLFYAYRLDELNKTIDDVDGLAKFYKYYGLTTKDMGLYALLDNKIAGAVWMRLLEGSDTPVLTIGIKPEFRGQGVGFAMLNQLLLEAGAIFDKVSVSVLKDSKAVSFFEKFGFVKANDLDGKSIVDGLDTVTLFKDITKEAVVRPTDGYDPTRWMD